MATPISPSSSFIAGVNPRLSQSGHFSPVNVGFPSPSSSPSAPMHITPGTPPNGVSRSSSVSEMEAKLRAEQVELAARQAALEAQQAQIREQQQAMMALQAQLEADRLRLDEQQKLASSYNPQLYSPQPQTPVSQPAVENHTSPFVQPILFGGAEAHREEPPPPPEEEDSLVPPAEPTPTSTTPTNTSTRSSTVDAILIDPSMLLHEDEPPPPPEEDESAPSSYFGSGGMDDEEFPPPPPEDEDHANSSASSSTAHSTNPSLTSPMDFHSGGHATSSTALAVPSSSAATSPNLFNGTPPSPHGSHFPQSSMGSASAPTASSPISAATTSPTGSPRLNSSSEIRAEEELGDMRPDDVTEFVPIAGQKKDYSAMYTIKDKVVDDLVFFSRNFQIIVKGGTLYKLTERLSGESTTDNDYIDTFLLTYRSFISPTDLLEQLLDRYKTGSEEIESEGLSEIEATNAEKKQKLIRIRVGNVIKRWLSDHYHDFHDPTLLSRLEEGISEITENQLQATLRKTIQEQQLQKNKIRDLMFSKEKPTPIQPKGSTFDDWDVVEVARQLCLYEQTIYQGIHPKEALGQSWNKHKERAPNLLKMITFFNRLSKWVSTQVCLREDLKERVKLIMKFMQLSMQLRQYNNFDGMQAVLSGINNTSVWRMKQSWAKIEKKDKFFQQWKQMSSVITDTANNFNAYRTAVSTADPPIIPYLGVYLTDLTFTEDGNPDYLRVQDNRDDIINFEKMRRVAVVIKDICTYQQTPYNFEKVPMIYDFFSGELPFEDDQPLFNRSRKLEPPNSVLTPKKSKKTLSFTRRVSFGMFSKDKDKEKSGTDSEPGSPHSSSSPKGDKKKDKDSKKGLFK